ncbi:MAG: S-layer homology domain-containing protein [Eubacteriales bacterium]
MKRILTFVLAGALVLSGFPIVPNMSQATQSISYGAERHWSDQYLNNLVRNEIMQGDLQGNLNPDNDITRAEFVAMINRAFGYAQKGTSNFSDVDKEAWYSDDLSIAKNQGYMQGTDNNKAEPENKLTREQAVTLICRALKIEGEPKDTFKFGDSREFSQWSKEYINAVASKNIVNGYPDSTFKPLNSMTRGEMAKVLSNLAGEIIKETGKNYIGYADKNVSMVKSGASLTDTIVPGDLFLTAGLGKGYSLLEQVTVNGDLIISGTGNSESGQVSVLLRDSDIKHLIVDSQSSDIMSVRAEGGSVIEKTTVRRNAYLEEENDKNIAFKDVELKGVSGTKLNLSGNFENVKILAPNNQLSLSKGYINSLTVDEEADKGSVFLEKGTKVGALMLDTSTTVTGSGEIEQAIINADGTNLSMLPKRIYIRPGIKAVINGKTMTSLDAEANNAEPEFKSDYPKLTDVQATSAKLLASVNKPGKLYWAVKDMGVAQSGASKEDLLKPDTRYFIKSGNQAMVIEKEVTINIAGLKSGEEYEYYAMFEDLQGNRTGIKAEKFKTVDIIAPQFLGGTPVNTDRIADKTDPANIRFGFKFDVMPSKDGIIYWAIYKNRAVPPTAEALAEQKVSGALGKGLKDAKMNETYNIDVEGNDILLAEKKDYDIYFVIRDKAGNLSRLSKTVATTPDVTSPEFLTKPWNEPGARATVTVNTMASESGTIFWAAYPEHDDYISKISDTNLKIRAITTGDHAHRNGQKPTRGNVNEKIIIDKIEATKPYNVYFVIRDQSENESVIEVLKGIKTLDQVPPKAEMVFEDAVAGDPLVNSKITIQFDEVVYYKGEDKDIRLIEINNMEEASKVEKLKAMLTLHDLKSLTYPDNYNLIDYKNVVIAERDGKTAIDFPYTVFGGGKGLNSGGRYQFELNKVVDSDGNRMDAATRLQAFSIVAPQIGLQENDTLVDEVGFSVKRGENTIINSDSYYDIIITSNKLLKFDLYEKKGGIDTLIAEDIRLEANQGKSISRIRTVEPGFKEFKDVTDAEYKLKIKSMDAIEKTESWDGDLNVEATVVVGTQSDLRNLANGIVNKQDVMGIVEKNKTVQQVSNPRVLKITKTYADTAQPEIKGVITFNPTDTTVYVRLMTDKAATVHYVVLPLKEFIEKGAATPSPEDVLMGMPSYIAGKKGTITLPAGNVEVEELIKELEPSDPTQPDLKKGQYKFFYVVKGKSGDKLEVKSPNNNDVKDFETNEATVPKVIEPPGLVMTGKATKDSAEVAGTLNTEAVVYWVAFQHGTKTPSVEEVISMKDDNSEKTNSGSFPVTLRTHKDLKFTINVEKLDPTGSYDVFVALKNENSGVQSSEVYKLKGVLRSLDTEPPKLDEEPKTTVLGQKSIGYGHYSYDVSIVLKFTKELYYRTNKNESVAKPLTSDQIFTNALGPDNLYPKKPGGFLQTPAYVTASGISNSISNPDPSKRAITDIELSLKGVRNGTEIGLTPYIYSMSGSYKGKLNLVFVEDPVLKDTNGKIISTPGGHFEVRGDFNLKPQTNTNPKP